MRYGDVIARAAIASTAAEKKTMKSRMRAPATNSIVSAVASNTMAAPKSGSLQQQDTGQRQYEHRSQEAYELFAQALLRRTR